MYPARYACVSLQDLNMNPTASLRYRKKWLTIVGVNQNASQLSAEPIIS